MGAFNSNKRDNNNNNNHDGNDDKSIDFILRAHNVRSIYEISSRFETTAKWYQRKEKKIRARRVCVNFYFTFG